MAENAAARFLVNEEGYCIRHPNERCHIVRKKKKYKLHLLSGAKTEEEVEYRECPLCCKEQNEEYENMGQSKRDGNVHFSDDGKECTDQMVFVKLSPLIYKDPKALKESLKEHNFFSSKDRTTYWEVKPISYMRKSF